MACRCHRRPHIAQCVLGAPSHRLTLSQFRGAVSHSALSDPAFELWSPMPIFHRSLRFSSSHDRGDTQGSLFHAEHCFVLVGDNRMKQSRQKLNSTAEQSFRRFRSHNARHKKMCTVCPCHSVCAFCQCGLTPRQRAVQIVSRSNRLMRASLSSTASNSIPVPGPRGSPRKSACCVR
jgi:hypothetical protein